MTSSTDFRKHPLQSTTQAINKPSIFYPYNRVLYICPTVAWRHLVFESGNSWQRRPNLIDRD